VVGIHPHHGRHRDVPIDVQMTLVAHRNSASRSRIDS
jgi:hypothetical protein